MILVDGLYIQYICVHLSPQFIFALVLPVLKRNYARLCNSLPQDYMKTVDKLKQLMPGLPADYLDRLRTYPSTELINEAIISNAMCAIKADGDVFEFCSLMEKLCDDITSSNFIKALRNGKLKSGMLSLQYFNACVCIDKCAWSLLTCHFYNYEA